MQMRFFVILLVLVASITAIVIGCGNHGEGIAREAGIGDNYGPRVAVGMYVWRQDRARRQIDYFDDLDAVFAEARQAGAEYVEDFLSLFDTDQRAETTIRLLKKHKLKLAGLYTNANLDDEKEARKTVDDILIKAARAKSLGHFFIDVNPRPLPQKALKSDKQLETQVRMLNLLGNKLADMGLQLVVHHHDAELKQNAREHRYNVKNVNPKYVGFCMDTHWVYRGGLDPATLLTEAGPKLKAIHLRNSVNNVWTESFGPGDIDHAPIAKYLREINYDGWLTIELAHEKDTRITRTLTENVRQGLSYLKSQFLDASSAGSFDEWNNHLSGIIGSTHAAGKYYFTSRDYVNEGAVEIANAGMRVLKLWFASPIGHYPWNCNWPEEFDDYVQMAEHPHYRELFNRPFDTYVLTLFEQEDFRHGLPDPLPAIVEQRYYDLARHLLENYAGTGKTFIIGHHEGDWHLRGNTNLDPRYDPNQTVINGMIRWYDARQRGVDRAKQDCPVQGVNLYHAAEVNLVLLAMNGRPTVTNDVLPYVNCDLVSYSAYDTVIHTHREHNEAKWRETFRQALDYLDSKVADKPPFGSKNIFIAEYGGPEQQWGGDEQAEQDLLRMTRATVEESVSWGCPYVIYWQVYCNECRLVERGHRKRVGGSIARGTKPVTRNKDCRGFWMIKTDGTYSVARDYFTGLLDPYLTPPSDFTPSILADSGKIRLSWSDSLNQANYRLEKSVNSEPYVLLCESPTNKTFHNDKNVQTGNSYRYRLRSEKTGYRPTSWFYTDRIEF